MVTLLVQCIQNFFLDEAAIPNSEYFWDLGVLMDTSLKFHLHVREIYSKAWGESQFIWRGTVWKIMNNMSENLTNTFCFLYVGIIYRHNKKIHVLHCNTDARERFLSVCVVLRWIPFLRKMFLLHLLVNLSLLHASLSNFLFNFVYFSFIFMSVCAVICLLLLLVEVGNLHSCFFFVLFFL